MKRLLLLALCAIGSFYAQSQTKGTNAIGLGLSSRQTKDENPNEGYFSNKKENYASLTYGRFIKDNVRLGFTANYSYNELSQDIGYDQTTRGYGAGINYQKYYPLFKKFYVVAGGKGEYFYSKIEGSFGTPTTYKQNYYTVGAYGSAAYFLSKHFALEARLLSADVGYSRNKNSIDDRKLTESTFNLSSSGAINNLSFQIYFLF